MLTELSQCAYLLLLLIFVPIPFATDRTIASRPYTTYALIAINAIVFFGWIFPSAGTDAQRQIFASFGLVPRFPSSWTFVTSLFIHINPTHLIWNMAFLWMFGPSCEDTLGHFVYLVFYLAGGIVAGLLHTAIVLLFAENSAVAFAPLVGASGAISALVGMYALRFYRSKLRLIWLCASFLRLKTAMFEIPAIAGLALWFLQNLFGAVSALFQPDRNGIAYWAHIGGFLFGMTVAEFAGMLGEGMREYLFNDALTAQVTGDDGVRAAVANFRILLQKRPDDQAIRASLAEVAARPASAENQSVRTTVAQTYAALAEQAMMARNASLADDWLRQFDNIRGDDLLDKHALFRLAETAMSFGYLAHAELFFDRVARRFGGTKEARHADLRLTELWLCSVRPLSPSVKEILNRLRDDLRTAS
jgi:membrane associated rhomboid family serine protease